jgi:alkyl hydroperoxide reductase subunit AhpF
MHATDLAGQQAPSQERSRELFDVAVVGGGPAGRAQG